MYSRCVGSSRDEYKWSTTVVAVVTAALIFCFLTAAAADGGGAPTPGATIYVPDLFSKIGEETGTAPEEFREEAIAELRQAGYDVIDETKPAFKEAKGRTSAFRLQGTVNELLCQGKYVNICKIIITWELLPRGAFVPVYKVDTRATESPVTEQNKDQKLKSLVRLSVRSLLSRTAFTQQLAKPTTGATPAGPLDYPAAQFTACKTKSLSMPGDTTAVLDATVLIETPRGFGSGVMVSPDGFVMTAAHVVMGGPVKVIFRDRREAAAELVRINNSRDVALLKVAGIGYPCVEVSGHQPTIGNKVFVIGSPASKDLSFSLSAGLVSAMREWNDISFLQTDASVNPGNSGGPMLDENGRLIAIVSWKLAGIGVEGVGFGVPVDAVLKTLRLKPGTRTDDSLTKQTLATSADTSQTFVDTADQLPPAQEKRVVQTHFPPPRVPLALNLGRWGGLALGVVGAGMAIITYSVAKGGTSMDFPTVTHEQFDRLESINVAGLITAGVGAALFVTSWTIILVQRSKARKEAEQQVARQPGAELRLDAVGLEVRF